MYCRNCGKPVTGLPEFCPGCGARPHAGSTFCSNCGSQTDPLAEVCLKCGARLSRLAPDISSKSRTVLVLLAYFLGIFGAHRFYAGRTRSAVIMLVLPILGIIAYAAFVGAMMAGAITGTDDTAFFITTALVMVPAGMLWMAAAIWSLIDLIFAVIGKFRDRDGKLISQW